MEQERNVHFTKNNSVYAQALASALVDPRNLSCANLIRPMVYLEHDPTLPFRCRREKCTFCSQEKGTMCNGNRSHDDVNNSVNNVNSVNSADINDSKPDFSEADTVSNSCELLGRKTKKDGKEWSKKEVKKLFAEYYSKSNCDLTYISSLFPDKSEEEIRKKISYYGKKKDKMFSKFDDIRIIELVHKHGKNWDLITKLLGRFKKETIIRRYNNHLDPNINNDVFSESEDSLIVKLQGIYKYDWEKIATFFPGRNSEKIKNRYYSSIKKRIQNSVNL